MPDLIRSFVGIPLGDAGRARLKALQDELRVAWPAVRWVDPALLHLTLMFLGDVSEDRLKDLGRLLGERLGGHERIEARLEGLGAFPSPSRPRVLWVGVGGAAEAAALGGLHAAARSAVDEVGIRVEDDRFHPHVTIGRIKPGQRLRAGTAFADREGQTLGVFPVDEVVVYRSDLGSRGAQYTRLSVVELGVKNGA